jgi:hypothetical protein
MIRTTTTTTTTTIVEMFFDYSDDNFPKKNNFFRMRRTLNNPKPVRPVPVDQGIFPADVLDTMKDFVIEDPVSRQHHLHLSTLFEQAFLATYPGGSENNIISFWDKMVRSPLEFLSNCFVDEIKLICNRNVTDPTGTVRQSSRPDFIAWLERVSELNNTLVLIGEEKADDMNDALADLISKCVQDGADISWTGTMFVFAYAAGGSCIR